MRKQVKFWIDEFELAAVIANELRARNAHDSLVEDGVIDDEANRRNHINLDNKRAVMEATKKVLHNGGMNKIFNLRDDLDDELLRKGEQIAHALFDLPNAS